jgi:hypothetical protein
MRALLTQAMRKPGSRSREPAPVYCIPTNTGTWIGAIENVEKDDQRHRDRGRPPQRRHSAIVLREGRSRGLSASPSVHVTAMRRATIADPHSCSTRRSARPSGPSCRVTRADQMAIVKPSRLGPDHVADAAEPAQGERCRPAGATNRRGERSALAGQFPSVSLA